jgi:pimeloyl-ACP methyl ester carboxylesterase
MRRLIRIFAYLVLAILFIAFAALAGFTFQASNRESLPPEQAAGEGARFVSAGDLRIHYSEWGPKDGQPLVLVPGTLAWSQTFRDIAEPLAENGFRVISPDMPPFGYSERPSDGNYSREAQAKRLLAFADALGLKRFALGVHSFGGGAAIEAAFQQPERISGLILLDVAIGLGQPALRTPPMPLLMDLAPFRHVLTASTLTNPLMVAPGLRYFVHDDGIVTPDRVELYTRPLNVEGTTEAIGAWVLTGLFGDDRHALSADLVSFHEFKAPVLIIWGREDQITPLAQGEQIADAFPNSRLEILDGVNHIPQIERPVGVTRLIGDFMASLLNETEAVGDKQPRLQPNDGAGGQ